MQNVVQQAQPMSIPPALEVPVTLQAQEWQTIIQILHEVPYRVSDPLIKKIGSQVASAAQVQMAMAERPERPNGAGEPA